MVTDRQYISKQYHRLLQQKEKKRTYDVDQAING